MSRKLALSLLLLMLGLASYDAVLDSQGTTQEDGQVRTMDDACGMPPR